MTQTSEVKEYNVGRKVASKLLGVSIRTLDRYIRSKKVSTHIVDGRVWLSKKELEGYREKKVVDKIRLSTPNMSIDNRVDKVDSKIDTSIDNDDNEVEIVEERSQSPISNIRRERKSSNSSPYKKLYSEMKEDLEEKQQRLEIANYRIGQLQAELKNSIPLLEHYNNNHKKQQELTGFKEKLTISAKLLQKLQNQLKYSKASKTIFAILLLSLLALQPLWLLLFYK